MAELVNLFTWTAWDIDLGQSPITTLHRESRPVPITRSRSRLARIGVGLALTDLRTAETTDAAHRSTRDEPVQ